MAKNSSGLHEGSPMTDPAKMTAEERAVLILRSSGNSFDLKSLIENQIQQAVDQARKEGFEEGRKASDEVFVLRVDCEFGKHCIGKGCSGASHYLTYDQIFAQAREMAAKVCVDISENYWQATRPDTNMGSEATSAAATKIRALQPPREGAE